MAEFSISDAALTGFRVVRERPRAVLIWAAFQLAFSILMQALIVATASPALMDMVSNPHVLSQAEAVAFLGQAMRLAVVLLPFALAYYAIVLAAMNRIVLRPGDDRFGYLRLGADELRQLGLVALASLVFFGIEIILAIGAGLLAALLNVAKASPASFLAPLLLVYAALVLIAVRFSLASALTFDRRKVDLFGSWRLTRGRFWPLFGTLVLTLALTLVIGVLGFVITGALRLIVAGGDVSALFSQSRAFSAGTLLSASNLIALALNAVVTALVWPIMLTPGPEIYRALTGAVGSAQSA